ncbi:hypothetical protein CMK11_10980 [Candidatus Poribacteria bacterium]|nr:hypothetical protein [Candidatus Poribacteria bacterium]
MATTTREQLHAMIDDLNDDCLEAARDALRRLEATGERDAEQRFAQSLVDDGLLAGEPPALSAAERRRMRERPSMTLEGETIAQTIIRERGPVA